MLDQGNNNRAGEGDGYRALNNLRIDADLRFVDTRDVALSIPELKSHSLTAVAEHYGIAT